METKLKNQISELEKDNKNLNDSYNEIYMKLSLMNTNMMILEKEKGRHLEVNAVEKEKFQAQIENLMIQNEEADKIIQNVNNENQALYEKINKVNQKIRNF
jgi:hypothetical protein